MNGIVRCFINIGIKYFQIRRRTLAADWFSVHKRSRPLSQCRRSNDISISFTIASISCSKSKKHCFRQCFSPFNSIIMFSVDVDLTTWFIVDLILPASVQLCVLSPPICSDLLLTCVQFVPCPSIASALLHEVFRVVVIRHRNRKSQAVSTIICR